MDITSGKIVKAKKCVVYGPEGIGKSTFGSKFPKPLFIDVEGSTAELDVDRLPRATSWGMLMGLIAALRKDRLGYKTLVLDTGDWAERLGIEEICAKYQIASLGSSMNGEKDYGKSYNLWADEWGRFLNALTDLTEVGMHVLILCHARIRTQQLPEEFGAFDHWELKLEKKTSALNKEWADMLLFANYKTLVIEDSKTKTKKAQGGSRVMYTSHHPCWDAKNRHGLAEELPFDFAAISHCFPTVTPTTSSSTLATAPITTAALKDAPVNGKPALKKLQDIMAQDKIGVRELQKYIAGKGWFPEDTPLENLPEKFIEGGVIPNWQKVVQTIKGAQAA